MAKREIKNCTLCDSKYLSWRKTQKFCSKSCAATGVNGNSYRHGHAGKNNQSITYSTWASMINRTKGNTPHSKKYYVDVIVAESWKDYNNFLNDMGERPSLKHSIDRINPSIGYVAQNCRWATRQEQMNNIRTNKLITYKGETLTQSQWADRIGVNQTAICKRLKRGWSIEKTLTTPYLR
jgi:hypothetical protein